MVNCFKIRSKKINSILKNYFYGTNTKHSNKKEVTNLMTYDLFTAVRTGLT